MNNRKKHMNLGLFFVAPGHHIAAWRHPDSLPNAYLDFDYYKKIALMAEKGKFDMFFLADSIGIRTIKDNEELSRSDCVAYFEPLTLLSALSTITTNIGLVATASTSYNEPFNIARKFASIDFLSKGRSGWNVVTSGTDSEAKNMNLDVQLNHSTRYRRANEFMHVVTGLWDSWADDAFLYNKDACRYFDPNKMHVLNHQGEFFSVRGPLNIGRPPQGYPVIIQAGSSVDGINFAAKWAEVIFTAQQTLNEAKVFYRSVKDEVEACGRNSDNVIIMPGILPIIGSTREEATEKFHQLQELIDEKAGLNLLSGLLGNVLDLSTICI